MTILHNMQISGNCYKVRLAAKQCGFPVRLIEYPLAARRTREPEFLAKNPIGRVPLLELDDGRCLAESGAILCYIAEGTALIPAEPWQRAKMLEWMFFEQYEHEPYVAVARRWLAYEPKEALETKRALVPEWHAKGNAALRVMETRLATHNWLAGDSYSLADIALYGYTHVAHEGGFDLSLYPGIGAWLKRVAAMPNHIPLSESW
ncbi:MAG TPA: glutathione S-transferase family protein [Micropepsaceae bacterium]|jgi:glutathione S-transferase|nr:glutathione S-transferase family protein [Micropepsaceae bacterium]